MRPDLPEPVFDRVRYELELELTLQAVERCIVVCKVVGNTALARGYEGILKELPLLSLSNLLRQRMIAETRMRYPRLPRFDSAAFLDRWELTVRRKIEALKP